MYLWQRNMLAVKYHHLRALIHRPYLWSALLSGKTSDASLLAHDDDDSVRKFAQTCVAETRCTAHLLYNIQQESDLVYEFPWWQMISCLVCAGSILVVASSFVTPGDDWPERTELDQDADVCLQAFDVLSDRSDGAKTASSMLRQLRKRTVGGSLGAGAPLSGTTNVAAAESESIASITTPATSSAPFQGLDQHAPELTQVQNRHVDDGMFGMDQFLQRSDVWPLEILDSMSWTTQFFDDAQRTNAEV